MSHSSLPEIKPNESIDPNKSFKEWLKKHTLLYYSQLAILLGGASFIASFFYYIWHGDYIEYLEPRKVEEFIYWLHLIVLVVFIFSLLSIRNDKIDEDKKARKTFKGIFKREISKEDAEHGKTQLKDFKYWFFLFWVGMLLLYVGFFAQRYSVHNEPVGKEEIFRMFNEYSRKDVSEKENKKINGENLQEKAEKIRLMVESLPDDKTNSKEYEIYSAIKALPNSNLKERIGELTTDLKDKIKEIDTHLIENKPSANDQKLSDEYLIYDKNSIPYQNIIMICGKLEAAYNTDEREKRKALLEEVKEKTAPLLLENQYNPLKTVFTSIVNLDTVQSENNFLKNRFTAVADLIDDLETSNVLSRNQKVKEKLDLANETSDENLRVLAIKQAVSLSNQNDKWNDSLIRISFACITNILNNLGWWLIFVCFLITTTLNKEAKEKKEKRRIRISFAAVLILSVAFPAVLFTLFFRGVSESTITSWTAFFDGFSGIINAVALALLIARLDSKLIGLPSYLIGVLYFYAAFQPLFVVFEQPGEISQLIKTVVLVSVFISKVYFFLIITYAIQTERILTYLYCFPFLSKQVDKIFANPFQINCEEESHSFNIKILRNDEEVFYYNHPYENNDPEEQRKKIVEELRENAKHEKYFKVIQTNSDKIDKRYEIKIYGKSEKVICQSKDESLTPEEARKLKEQCKKFIPDCEEHLINKSKQSHTPASEENMENKLPDSI